jgi:hypothetical protein
MKSQKKIALSIGLLIGAGCTSPPRQEQTGKPPIPYEVVQEWDIPNGGFGRVIVIDSSNRNELDLRHLGEELRDTTRHDRNAGVEVYDNVEAAKLRDAGLVEKLPKKKQAFHDAHRIGDYTRNGNTGHNQWVFGLHGLMADPVVTVKF